MKLNISGYLQKLCSPALFFIVVKTYFIIAVFARTLQLPQMIASMAITLLIVHALNTLCKKGYKWLSWGIVLFPYIMTMLLLFRVVSHNSYTDILVL